MLGCTDPAAAIGTDHDVKTGTGLLLQLGEGPAGPRRAGDVAAVLVGDRHDAALPLLYRRWQSSQTSLRLGQTAGFGGLIRVALLEDWHAEGPSLWRQTRIQSEPPTPSSAMPDQLVDMGADAAAEGGEVVAALEAGDDAFAGVADG